jgi:hypothetical protein
MPITANTLAQYKNGNICIETGCLVGDGIRAALDAGFSCVVSIEIDPKLAKKARKRFRGAPVFIISGNTVEQLPILLQRIHEPVTFWLDAHPVDSSPVLLELASIEQHHIKTHTILIDDRRLMGTDWKNVSEDVVVATLMRINPTYEISYAPGYVERDIIVAMVARR